MPIKKFRVLIANLFYLRRIKVRRVLEFQGRLPNNHDILLDIGSHDTEKRGLY